MAIPAALMGAGTTIQAIGQIGANLQQAITERANQKFYKQQAEYAQESALRAERLAGFEYAYKIGQQVGDYAASGVDAGSGSAATTIGGSIANEIGEIAAIRKKGALDTALARMRGTQAGQTADTLGSFGYNFLQTGASILRNYTASEGFGTWNDGRSDITDKYPGYGSGYGSAGTSLTDYTNVA